MTTILATAAIFISLGGWLDFLLGEPGNRKIRDRLADFYFSVDEGDWSKLYRSPAAGLLRFMQTLLSTKLVSPLFLIRTATLSIIFTALMLVSYFVFVYLQAVWHQTAECSAPPLLMAAREIPRFSRQVLVEVFFVNAVFDLITWSATIYSLRTMCATRNKYTAMSIVLVGFAFALAILHLLHSVYLPLSLGQDAREYGIRFGSHEYLKFFRNGLLAPLGELLHLNGFITIGCFSPNAAPFGVSFISLTQYAALEALIPVVLFAIACFLGSVAYLTRRFTRKPIALFAERLASSKSVCVTVASLLSGLLAIVKILAGMQH